MNVKGKVVIAMSMALVMLAAATQPARATEVPPDCSNGGIFYFDCSCDSVADNFCEAYTWEHPECGFAHAQGCFGGQVWCAFGGT